MKEKIRVTNFRNDRVTEEVCTKYTCEDCKITMKQSRDCHYESRPGDKYWHIPNNIPRTITEKQKRCIEVICNVLKIDKPLIINKSLASKFINQHIEASKRIVENSIQENGREYNN